MCNNNLKMLVCVLEVLCTNPVFVLCTGRLCNNSVYQLTHQQPVCLTIWNYVWPENKRQMTKHHNAQCHLGQLEDWIFCVSLSRPTCNIWRNVLSHTCRSIGCQFKRSINTVIPCVLQGCWTCCTVCWLTHPRPSTWSRRNTSSPLSRSSTNTDEIPRSHLWECFIHIIVY